MKFLTIHMIVVVSICIQKLVLETSSSFLQNEANTLFLGWQRLATCKDAYCEDIIDELVLLIEHADLNSGN